MHKNIVISFLASTTIFSSWAQSNEPEPARVQWGMSGGMNEYEEPDFMKLKGPEVGLHSRVAHWSNMPNAQFEGDILLGKQKYTSVSSGNLSGVTNLETRWRALVPVFSDTPTTEGFFTGLAFHTLWNDLRGTSTYNGETYGGYQRSAAQLWLPLRWASGNVWELDAGLLIYGRHTSKLSEVGPNYSDAVNTQRNGQYAQIAMKVKLKDGDAVKPFIRYTHLDDSDSVIIRGPLNNCPSGLCNATEPMSKRWQVGAVWEFNTR